MTKRFDVALSFPGEARTLADSVAAVLSTHIPQDRVFYDRYYEAELARPNLDTYLQNIYHDQAHLIVVFLCEDYEKKDWCHIEFRAIRDLIKKRKDDEVMFIRAGEGDVSGVFSIDGSLDARMKTPVEIAEAVLKRINNLVPDCAINGTVPDGFDHVENMLKLRLDEALKSLGYPLNSGSHYMLWSWSSILDEPGLHGQTSKGRDICPCGILRPRPYAARGLHQAYAGRNRVVPSSDLAIGVSSWFPESMTTPSGFRGGPLGGNYYMLGLPELKGYPG